ncbi:ankyrin repeat-containing domain protein [Aspergillus pseudoustus]|uniref:Ankyrin repeat-containing domain protein n=1 Tax=Aspergillus pseudoustus TaxID=1810923 RepID=A0ABR4IMI8_9EURO
MPKDFVMCLKWLENAALRGSKKAVMALPNVTASLGGAMSSEAQAAVRSRLPEIAKEELLMSVSHIFTGRIPNRDEFPASRLWKELDSGPFEEHMASDEFHVLKGLCLAICLITHGVEREDELFDFAHLEGYRARSLTKFDPSDKDAFIRSVRKHDCLKAVGVEKLTVLQLAAATGDLELTRTLVLDLRADVNDYGITPRLTPLWISCFFGNMEVAAFLAEHGADAGCRDDIANRTILHFANQCHTEEDLHRLLQIAGSASLGLDVQDGSGNTPLLSTFIGWDFSNGLASRALLSKKAFSLFRSNTGWDSLCAAVVTLNYGLVKDIVDSCSLLSSEPLRRNKLSINEAKATAFGALFSMSEFYRRRIDGSKGSSTLGQIVDLLLDDGSIAALKKMDFAKDTNPLIAACFMGFEDLSSAILDSPHCPPINGHDDNNSMTALHWAMQRGRESTVMRLLERGADPLLKDNEGLNAFHHAARFSPELLDIIVAKMDKGELPKPEGMHMKDIISTPAANGETSFAIAVTEGSVQHLELAEKLRTKYELDHDTPSIKRGGSKMTLMAYMIRNATISNVFTLEQIEYVLNIDPRPKFVADTSNSTLLHYAVAHWHHAEIASNPVGFAVLRLLLRTFPDRKYLDMVNDGGYSAMHYAALHSNIQALEIIHDHLLATNQVFDPNCSANNGPPTLHVVGKIEENVNMKEEDEPALFTILRRKTAQTYEFLRGHGAYYAHEREPVTVCNLACTQNMLSLVYLRCFLEIIQERTGFAWEIKSEDSNIPPELEGTNQAAFVVELCWVRDRFILKAMQILTQDLEHHCMERERVSFRLTHGDTKFPWTRLEYEDTIHGHIVRWRRPGKLWTEEEVNLLKKKIVGAWAAIFDDSYVARPGQVTTSSPE